MNEVVMKLIGDEIAETQNLLTIMVDRQSRLMKLLQLLETPELPLTGSARRSPAADSATSGAEDPLPTADLDSAAPGAPASRPASAQSRPSSPRIR